jgi:hypothetical protein
MGRMRQSARGEDWHPHRPARISEGRSRPEIIRILKRYVARETYRHLPR